MLVMLWSHAGLPTVGQHDFTVVCVFEALSRAYHGLPQGLSFCFQSGDFLLELTNLLLTLLFHVNLLCTPLMKLNKSPKRQTGEVRQQHSFTSSTVILSKNLKKKKSFFDTRALTPFHCQVLENGVSWYSSHVSMFSVIRNKTSHVREAS